MTYSQGFYFSFFSVYETISFLQSLLLTVNNQPKYISMLNLYESEFDHTLKFKKK